MSVSRVNYYKKTLKYGEKMLNFKDFFQILIAYFFSQREIISIHIGQAGVQIGNSCWELFCLGILEYLFSSLN